MHKLIFLIKPYSLGLGVYLWDQQLYKDGTGAGSRATGNVKHG